MGVADWIILAFLLFSVATAAWEGFFHEAFGLVGLVVGYLVAAWQYRWLADWFDKYLKQQWLGDITAFLIIFFVVLIIAGIFGRRARGLRKAAGFTARDRTLGGWLGLLKGSGVGAIVLGAGAASAPAA